MRSVASSRVSSSEPSRFRKLCGDDRGSVAAEFAVALPAVLLIVVLAVGAMHAQAERIVLQDAASDAARLIARGEDGGRADALIAKAVPGGGLSIAPNGDLVCVRASAPVRVFPGVLIDITASACALAGGQ